MEFDFITEDKFTNKYSKFKMLKPKICDFLEASKDGSQLCIEMGNQMTIDHNSIKFICNLVEILGEFTTESGDVVPLTREDIERLDADFFMNVFLFIQLGYSPTVLLNNQVSQILGEDKEEPQPEESEQQ